MAGKKVRAFVDPNAKRLLSVLETRWRRQRAHRTNSVSPFPIAPGRRSSVAARRLSRLGSEGGKDGHLGLDASVWDRDVMSGVGDGAGAPAGAGVGDPHLDGAAVESLVGSRATIGRRARCVLEACGLIRECRTASLLFLRLVDASEADDWVCHSCDDGRRALSFLSRVVM
jgi:hypothetical protein